MKSACHSWLHVYISCTSCCAAHSATVITGWQRELTDLQPSLESSFPCSRLLGLLSKMQPLYQSVMQRTMASALLCRSCNAQQGCIEQREYACKCVIDGQVHKRVSAFAWSNPSYVRQQMRLQTLMVCCPFVVRGSGLQEPQAGVCS